jgi:hypothetical protein
MIRRLLSALLLFLCVNTTLVQADAIVRSQAMFADTIAEFYVNEAGVRLELEIGIADLSAFRNLLPDQVYQELGYEFRPWAERLPEFFTADLAILVDRQPLLGELKSIGPQDRVLRDNVTGEELPVAEENAEKVIIAELFYPFTEGKPDSIVLTAPTRYGQPGIGFVVYHNTVAVNDFRYLSSGMLLNLDWEDPWYSAFHSKSMRRSYFAPMSGFLYVEPFEVRKEIIVRPKDMQRWVDLGLDGVKSIPADQRGTLLERVSGFLMARQEVSINGERVKPILDRANFLNRNLKRSMVVEAGIDINIDSAVVGVIFVYPTPSLSNKVTMTWDMFDERIQLVPASSVDEAGPLPTFLDPEFPVLEWENFLKNPTDPGLLSLALPPSRLSLLLYQLRWYALGSVLLLLVIWGRNKNPVVAVAAALLGVMVGLSFVIGRPLAPPGETTDQVVADLLRNIYKAFDYREESDIYDILERSVSGDLLTDIYLETQRGLELANQGGARAKVQDVAMQSLEILPGEHSGEFRANATWNVNGSVGHWGHVHARVNQYQAELDIEAVEGRWKLTGMNVLQEQRL